MKHLLIFTLAIACLWACKNPKTTTGPTAPPPGLTPGSNGITETVMAYDSISGSVREREKPINALSTAIGKTTSSTIDPVEPKKYYMKAATQENQNVVKSMTNNYWAVWALSRTNNPANEENQGAWFKFFPDLTYEYGFLEKRVGKGTWFIDWSKATIFLDSELLGDDREWTIKLGRDGDVMIWIGTDQSMTMDIQMKLINLMVIPKKRQDLGLD